MLTYGIKTLFSNAFSDGIDDSGQNAQTPTYAALLQTSEQLALALSTRFKHGEKIVVWAPNHAEWTLMEYACALAGLVMVTANPSFQAKELRYVLEQSGAVALFYVEEFRGNPMAAIAQEALIGVDLNETERRLLRSQQIFNAFSVEGFEDLIASWLNRLF